MAHGDIRVGGNDGAQLLLEWLAEPLGGVVEDFAEVAVGGAVEDEDSTLPAWDAGLVFDWVDEAAEAEAREGVVV